MLFKFLKFVTKIKHSFIKTKKEDKFCIPPSFFYINRPPITRLYCQLLTPHWELQQFSYDCGGLMSFY